jgi:hypothetical protein
MGLSYHKYNKEDYMKTDDTPEGSENPLKGLGQRLKLHILIPIIYAAVLITVFIVTQKIE